MFKFKVLEKLNKPNRSRTVTAPQLEACKT